MLPKILRTRRGCCCTGEVADVIWEYRVVAHWHEIIRIRNPVSKRWHEEAGDVRPHRRRRKVVRLEHRHERLQALFLLAAVIRQEGQVVDILLQRRGIYEIALATNCENHPARKSK